MLDIFTSASC